LAVFLGYEFIDICMPAFLYQPDMWPGELPAANIRRILKNIGLGEDSFWFMVDTLQYYA
jgi:hypothetical protein